MINKHITRNLFLFKWISIFNRNFYTSTYTILGCGCDDQLHDKNIFLNSMKRCLQFRCKLKPFIIQHTRVRFHWKTNVILFKEPKEKQMVRSLANERCCNSQWLRKKNMKLKKGTRKERCKNAGCGICISVIVWMKILFLIVGNYFFSFANRRTTLCFRYTNKLKCRWKLKK